MQGLWSRAASSSQSTCRCVSCLSTVTNGVSSRTTTSAARRRLRIGNSLTVFYSSIFAGAALADARAKAKRRSELEQKIAAVKEEVDVLAHEEERLLKTLATRRRRRVDHQTTHQKRSYSTAVRPERAPRTAQDVSASDFPPVLNQELDEEPFGETIGPEEVLVRDDADDQIDDPSMWEDSSVYELVGDAVRIKALQKLALKQLAFRLVLRPTIAHDYAGVAVDHDRDHNIPPLNTADMMAQLNRVRLRIHALKQDSKLGVEDLVGSLTTMQHAEVLKQNKRLDSALEAELEAFLAGHRSLPEVLFFISDNLLRSSDPDRTTAFRQIIFVFTRTRHNDIVELVLRAILPYYFSLTSSLITTILAYFRKAKDLKGFDMFLKMLTGDGYPVKVPTLEPYSRRHINGVEIVVPPLDSHNFVVYTEFINAALRFDQPDRADAWLQAARAKGFMDNYPTLTSYLRFYGIRKDWKKGLHTLQRALAYITSSTAHREDRMERLIMRMVHMCDQCRQPYYADLIIQAAIQSGFDPTLPSRQYDFESRVDPQSQRWHAAAAGTEKDAMDRPVWEKCFLFSRAVGPKLSSALVSARDTSDDKRSMLDRTSESVLLASLTNHNLQPGRGPGSASPNGDRVGDLGSDTAQKQEPENQHSTDVQRQQQQQRQGPLPSSHHEELEELRNEVSELRQMIIRLRLSTQFKVQPTQAQHQHVMKSAREVPPPRRPNDSIPNVSNDGTTNSRYRNPSNSASFPALEEDRPPTFQVRYIK